MLSSIGAAGRGGVGVGNGRTVFRSESGFSVTYADALALKLCSKVNFEISNDKLVKANGRISKIEFTASKGKVKNVAEAEALFKQRQPGKPYKFLWLKGAEGLAYEGRSSDRLFGI